MWLHFSILILLYGLLPPLNLGLAAQNRLDGLFNAGHHMRPNKRHVKDEEFIDPKTGDWTHMKYDLELVSCARCTCKKPSGILHEKTTTESCYR